MVKLSLCMIVKDEADNLEACLKSVRSIVDEMIVVDTGSTDATVAIARQLGATVHFYTWTHDFAAARNAALQYVSGDWILFLDADERMTPEIGPILRQAIEQEDCLVLNLIRHEVGAAQSPYSLVSRLFRAHPDMVFKRPYHAMIDDSVVEILAREPHWTVREIPDVAILHEGYQSEAIASRDKAQRARMAMERFLIDHPGDPYVCSKLGALYLDLERPTYGIELLERGLKTEPLDAPIAFELHYHLGIAYSRMKCVAQAAHHYQQAIEEPILPALKLGAYINLGRVRQLSGDVQGALEVYEAAIAIEPTFATAHYNLGMALKATGQLTRAIACYQEAIRLQPDYAQAHQNLGVVWLKLGRVPEAMAAFERAIALYQHQNPDEAQRLQTELRDMGFQIEIKDCSK